MTLLIIFSIYQVISLIPDHERAQHPQIFQLTLPRQLTRQCLPQLLLRGRHLELLTNSVH